MTRSLGRPLARERDLPCTGLFTVFFFFLAVAKALVLFFGTDNTCGPAIAAPVFERRRNAGGLSSSGLPLRAGLPAGALVGAHSLIGRLITSQEAFRKRYELIVENSFTHTCR